MKLTKLYIHNYKSFYDTTIELDKMNIVVGENNSGKSNLIDVLEFIDIAMTTDIERAISDKGGYENLLNYSAVGENKVIIRATFHKEKSSLIDLISSNSNSTLDFSGQVQGDGDITFSFSFSKDYNIFSIYFDMRVRCIKNENRDKFEMLYARELQKEEYKNIKFVISNLKFYDLKRNSKRKLVTLSNNHKEYINSCLHGISHLVGLYVIENLTIVKTNMIYFDTYYFNSERIRQISNQNTTELTLLKDGSNLGKILFNIKEEDKNKFKIISNSLITTVNEIASVEVQKNLGSYAIGFKERNKEAIPIHIVSDGTINFLATITALNQYNNNNRLLVFEEPERHLHLKAVNYMLQAFRDSQKQILITTHSTEILKYANLEEIIFIYRDSDGDTQSIRADELPDLKGKMERLGYARPMTLDELIADRVIGDFE